MFATTSRLSVRRLRRLLSLILLPAVLLSLFAPAAPLARAQEPPPPPPPPRYQARVLEGPQGEYFRAVDLNNHGQVVGTFAARPNDIPELWEDGRFTRLPMLAGELEPFYPQPNALNDAGHVLVRDSSGLHIWIGGSYVTLTRPEPYYWSSAYLSAATLNNRGVVYAPIIDYRTYPNRGTAVFWSSGAFGFLPAPSNTSAVITTDLNDANQAVGAYLLDVGNGSVIAGFRYVNNQVQVLTAPNNSYTRPEAINSQGQIVGIAYTTQGMDRPVVWQADGTIADLPIGTASGGRAIDINDNGDIIGELRDVGPVLWRGGVLYRLAELLPAELQLNLTRAVSINNAGQILVEGTPPGRQPRFYLLTPEERPELTIDSVALEQGDYPAGAWVALPTYDGTAATTDGNMVRVTIRLRNPGDQPVEALLDVAETTTNTEIGFTCPDRVNVPPTGTGTPYEVQCTWNTSLYAFGAPFSENGAATPKPNRVLRVTLAPVGGTASTLDTPITVRPRPVFLIPTVNSTADRPATFVGSLATILADHPARWTFLTVTGMHAGGTNGDEDSATLDENAAVLHSFVEQQRAALDAWKFDIIAHGYGGLVARNYIATYQPTFGENLPAVTQLITLGTPNLGTPCAFAYGLAGILDSSINPQVWVDQLPGEVRAFNERVRGRMEAFATYAIGGSADSLACLTSPYLGDDPGDPPSDRLVPYDSAIYGSEQTFEVGSTHTLYIVDPAVHEQATAWLASLSVERVLPSQAAQAAQAATQPAESVQSAPIAEMLPVDLPAGATAERTITVPTATTLGVSLPSARALAAELVGPDGQVVASATVAETDSLGLRVERPLAGQWTLRLRSTSTTPQRVVALVQLIGSALLATAEAGAPAADGTRRITATVSEGGAPVTRADVTLQFPGATAPITLRDDGQSGDGAANDGIYTARVGGDDLYFAVVTVQSSAGKRLVPVVLTTGADAPVTPPQVSAGGPYTVAEGGSVQVSATGAAALSYAWDLDGDGSYETAGQRVSFSAASIDGPTSRLVRVRATDATTGLSATSTALVAVENLAPTATLVAPSTTTVGQPFTLTLSEASDAGGDPLQFAFDCGTGFGPPGGTPSTTCTSNVAGTLTVRASVADDDGGANTYSATLTVSAAPEPNQPDVPLCYADGAQTWQDFAQGTRRNGTAVPRRRSNPDLALGLPQRNDRLNFVSLGFGGSLTLRFANPLINDGTARADLRIWETSFGDRNRLWRRYPEAVRVEVSLDGRTWTEIGRTTDKDQAYDLVLPRAQFVRLTDISETRRFGAHDDGFDLDAVEALTGCVRP